VIKLLNSDVTSDLRRPLAAEIDKPPSLNTHKTHITCGRYTNDAKHVYDTDRKPWSTSRLVTAFPICDVIERLNHVTHVKGK
jgi:hypothetical protein